MGLFFKKKNKKDAKDNTGIKGQPAVGNDSPEINNEGSAADSEAGTVPMADSGKESFQTASKPAAVTDSKGEYLWNSIDDFSRSSNKGVRSSLQIPGFYMGSGKNIPEMSDETTEELLADIRSGSTEVNIDNMKISRSKEDFEPVTYHRRRRSSRRAGTSENEAEPVKLTAEERFALSRGISPRGTGEDAGKQTGKPESVQSRRTVERVRTDAEAVPDKAGTEAVPDKAGTEAGPGKAGTVAVPDKAGTEAVPGEAGTVAGPGKIGTEAGPGKAGTVAGPDKTGTETVPGKAGTVVGPDKAGTEAVPGKAGTVAGPDKAGTEAGPGKTGTEAGPDKTGTETVPDKTGTETVPDKNTEEKTDPDATGQEKANLDSGIVEDEPAGQEKEGPVQTQTVKESVVEVREAEDDEDEDDEPGDMDSAGRSILSMLISLALVGLVMVFVFSFKTFLKGRTYHKPELTKELGLEDQYDPNARYLEPEEGFMSCYVVIKELPKEGLTEDLIPGKRTNSSMEVSSGQILRASIRGTYSGKAYYQLENGMYITANGVYVEPLKLYVPVTGSLAITHVSSKGVKLRRWPDFESETNVVKSVFVGDVVNVTGRLLLVDGKTGAYVTDEGYFIINNEKYFEPHVVDPSQPVSTEKKEDSKKEKSE